MVYAANSGATSSSGIPYHQPGKALPRRFLRQQQLWFSIKCTAQPAYNIPWRCDCPEPPDGARQKHWTRLWHAPILRTRFRGWQSLSRFSFNPSSSVPLCFTDLRSLPESDSEAEMRRRVTEESVGPLTWGRSPDSGPIIQIAEREWHWCCHIISVRMSVLALLAASRGVV